MKKLLFIFALGYGLALWGYTTELKPSAFCMTFDESVAAEVAAAGFAGVEICAPNGGLDETTARAWRDIADRHGLRVHSVTASGWFLFNVPEKFDAEVARAKKDLRGAAILGADKLLIVPAGRVGKQVKMPPLKRGVWQATFDSHTLEMSSCSADGTDYPEYIDCQNRATKAASRAIRELVPVAGQLGVALAIENVANNLWMDPSFAAAFVKSFDSKWVRAFVDPANHIFTFDPVQWLDAMKGVTASIHVKDFKLSDDYEYGMDLRNFGEGSVDLKAVREAIERNGYSGWVSLEGEKKLTRREVRTRLDRFISGETVAPGAVDNALPGRWALNRACGWVGIRERLDGSDEVTVLWDSGSPVKFAYVKNEKGFVSAYTECTSTRNLLVMKPEWHYYRYMQMRVEDGRLKGWFMMLDGVGTVVVPKTEFIGTRCPDLPNSPDLSLLKFGKPVNLLADGLEGWEKIGETKNRHFGWTFADGILKNTIRYDSSGAPREHGINIATTCRDFEDFKISYDVKIPKDGNSGVYLRGIYEIQSLDSYGKPVDSHHMGAVYGRITPSVAAEKPADEWQHVDVTLCDRHATVILNGVKIIDNQPILGVTGGALSSDESKPGPIYLQGDHASAEYRNMILTPIVKE